LLPPRGVQEVYPIPTTSRVFLLRPPRILFSRFLNKSFPPPGPPPPLTSPSGTSLPRLSFALTPTVFDFWPLVEAGAFVVLPHFRRCFPFMALAPEFLRHLVLLSGYQFGPSCHLLLRLCSVCLFTTSLPGPCYLVIITRSSQVNPLLSPEIYGALECSQVIFVFPWNPYYSRTRGFLFFFSPARCHLLNTFSSLVGGVEG